MKNLLLKYTGLIITFFGAILMIGSAYYPSPYLSLDAFGISMGGLFTGVILFSLGGVLMAKYDDDFMEKIFDKIGKILEFF